MDSLQTELPDRLPLVVIMQRRVIENNPWIDHLWEAVAVTVDSRRLDGDGPCRRVREADGCTQELHRGFNLQLQIDECESYYHNLLSPRPRCYVVASLERDEPVPRLVTMSFDEAHAYMEGGEELFTVDVPPELYRWTEAFVLQHYVPRQRKRRKREAWHEAQRRE